MCVYVCWKSFHNFFDFGSTQLFWAETEAPLISAVLTWLRWWGGEFMPTGIEDKYYKPSQGNHILSTFTIPHVNDILQAKINWKMKIWRLIFLLWWKTKQGVRWILQNCFLCWPFSLSNSNSFAELFLSGLEQQLNLWNQSWNSFGSWYIHNFFK